MSNEANTRWTPVFDGQQAEIEIRGDRLYMDLGGKALNLTAEEVEQLADEIQVLHRIMVRRAERAEQVNPTVHQILDECQSNIEGYLGGKVPHPVSGKLRGQS